MTLWLCLQLPRLPLDALAGAPSGSSFDSPSSSPSDSSAGPGPGPGTGTGTGSVVYAQHGARRWVIACESGDLAARIAPGEALGSVQARFPDLRLKPRDRAAESAALQAVACAAYALGDRIVVLDEAPRGVFDLPWQAIAVEVGPSLRLFGGVPGLLERAQALQQSLPYATRLGVAPTIEAAALAARAGLAPIAETPDWTRALQDLPIGLLRWPLAAEAILSGSGHRVLGDLDRHGAAALAARLGPEFPQALLRLQGRLPDPRPGFEPPARYRRRLDLDAEIDDWQALLFPLRRLFEEFEAYLRARQVAATELTVTLARRRSEGESLVLRTTAPTQSAAVFLRLLRERWNARPPTAAANELRLRADRFPALAAPQAGLFDDGGAASEAWNGLLDRLRTRLGEAAVWQPGLTDDHRPEHAWSARGTFSPVAPLPPRPLWLLRRPQPLPAQRLPRDGRGPLGASERISLGWWDDDAVDRDYHRVQGVQGEGLWIYRDRTRGAWFLHGLDWAGTVRPPAGDGG